MSRSATSGAPSRFCGSRVRELRRIVAYKSRWRGSKLTLVSGRTDQTCSACLAVNPEMRDRTTSKFECSACGRTTTRQNNTAQLLSRVGRGEVMSFTG